MTKFKKEQLATVTLNRGDILRVVTGLELGAPCFRIEAKEADKKGARWYFIGQEYKLEDCIAEMNRRAGEFNKRFATQGF
jgi:hypothetical protein